LKQARTVFSAEKVWTSAGAAGASQIEITRNHWGLPRFDLLQVHNRLAWREPLATQQSMKAARQLRYCGGTTSHGLRHAELESILKTETLGFVPLNYNPLDREVEQRLLPLAQARGVAVIVNRPFQEGALLRGLQPCELAAVFAPAPVFHDLVLHRPRRGIGHAKVVLELNRRDVVLGLRHQVQRQEPRH
jgi:diketogulonate reductase-like aldo/keto reductase